MDIFSLLADVSWRLSLAPIVVLFGLALFWRGLRGGPNGEHGLLRPQAGALGRAEGWRVVLLGLVVAGLGAAWFWQTRVLLFLTLGIGFVEILEASAVIAAWRRGARPTPDCNSRRLRCSA